MKGYLHHYGPTVHACKHAGRASWLTDRNRVFSLLQIIKRLKKQLDANKETVKHQYMDGVQRLLESQIKCCSIAITDRQKVLKGQTEDLRQRIAAHLAQLTEVSDYQ